MWLQHPPTSQRGKWCSVWHALPGQDCPWDTEWLKVSLPYASWYSNTLNSIPNQELHYSSWRKCSQQTQDVNLHLVPALHMSSQPLPPTVWFSEALREVPLQRLWSWKDAEKTVEFDFVEGIKVITRFLYPKLGKDLSRSAVSLSVLSERVWGSGASWP